VIFSDARSINKLKRLARDAGENAHAGTPREAAENADALLLAVHWNQIDDVLAQAGDLSSKVIISCSLPLNAQNTELVVAHTSSGAEALAKKFPKARFISAFHTVPSEVLFDVFENRHKANKPSLLYCSDHSGSNEIGWRSLSRGTALAARYQESLASLGCLVEGSGSQCGAAPRLRSPTGEMGRLPPALFCGTGRQAAGLAAVVGGAAAGSGHLVVQCA
jgi:hypothetical protein